MYVFPMYATYLIYIVILDLLYTFLEFN
jgi:hypothetical protein